MAREYTATTANLEKHTYSSLDRYAKEGKTQVAKHQHGAGAAHALMCDMVALPPLYIHCVMCIVHFEFCLLHYALSMLQFFILHCAMCMLCII